MTHVWENSDDYLRVFEFLESARNFFYRNVSSTEGKPVGDKEAFKEALRNQIRHAEVVIALNSLYASQRDLSEFQLLFANASKIPVVLLPNFGAPAEPVKTLRELATEVISWDERALVDALRRQARHEQTGRWDTVEFKLD
ncbi:MAG: hypothetical protein R3E77_09440 [Steroidobacteraceae bacterium]